VVRAVAAALTNRPAWAGIARRNALAALRHAAARRNSPRASDCASFEDALAESRSDAGTHGVKVRALVDNIGNFLRTIVRSFEGPERPFTM